MAGELDVMGMALERLMRKVAALEREVAQLRRQENVAGAPISTANVSPIPSDAQFDSAFGAPGDISKGMFKLVDDAGLETAVYGAVPIGSSWFYWSLTKAT